MEDVEDRALESFDVRSPFWKRYVDDTCTAVPSGKVQHLLQHLNSIESTIQFTVEMQSEGILLFLDVKLHHKPDGSVSTTVYTVRPLIQISTWIDFLSHHPLLHKGAVISTLAVKYIDQRPILQRAMLELLRKNMLIA